MTASQGDVADPKHVRGFIDEAAADLDRAPHIVTCGSPTPIRMHLDLPWLAFAQPLAQEGCRVLGFDINPETTSIAGITGMVADIFKRQDAECIAVRVNNAGIRSYRRPLYL